ncbi:tRNA endonuclease ANKZF1 [Conger conger]|uniref:tRNA endonuclease ANKZF1 n=1 Tax=Conger conger TaxID=82655 RepID=UPI002A59D9C9|nr:tRNA endonuclease ANKZF1 [Conger conger]XP_061090821.1 tRNA endonuclease ANKZF1 [Conger conger]
MTTVPEYCSLFNCLQDQLLLEGIREILAVQGQPLSNDNASNDEEDLGQFLQENSNLDENKAEGIPVGEISDRMFCSACQCPFESREEQTEHYKLDWHRFNLRQRLVGRIPATAEEFERKTGADDMSSISGSDSEETDSDSNWCSHGDEEPASGGNESPVKMEQPLHRLNPRVIFQNAQGKYLSVYRCVLHNKKMDPVEDLASTLLNISCKSVWVILMTGGGHFAGAVFQGKEVLQHKTFHRYTVRAKRGTAQGLRDSKSQSIAPKSAGATLRRYNEAMLIKDVQDLLESWSDSLREANAIFLRAPSYNRTIFFGGRTPPLDKTDPRVRTLPFATRRATFREVVRVHETLSTLHVYGKDTDVSSILSPSKKAWRKKPSRPERAAQTSPARVTAPPVAAEEVQQEDGSTDEGDVEQLEVVEVTLGTLELREFEVHPSRRRRRRRKEGHRGAEAPREPEEPREGGDPVEGEERRAKRRPRRAKKTQPAEEGGGADGGEYGVLDAVFTACKTGQLDALRSLLQLQDQGNEEEGGEEEGRGCQSPEDARARPSSAFLNREVDSSGFTFLHVASAAAQRDVVRLLLDAGADPACRDLKGQTPYAVAPDKDTRNVFRKYMAEHPDKYDYIKAQIPGPLTEEIELKKAEKRRVQKAARKQREKEQKEGRQKEQAELEEKRKFASLSDREKRALAAEKRLAQQMASTGTEFANTRRCWQCGESLLGKIPFEYLHFCFCTTQCVQQHRKAKASDTKP